MDLGLFRYVSANARQQSEGENVEVVKHAGPVLAACQHRTCKRGPGLKQEPAISKETVNCGRESNRSHLLAEEM
jgi:hypothetical protein